MIVLFKQNPNWGILSINIADLHPKKLSIYLPHCDPQTVLVFRARPQIAMSILARAAEIHDLYILTVKLFVLSKWYFIYNEIKQK